MSKSVLQNVYLFKTLSGQELDQINTILQTKDVVRGDTIFLNGEKATALYLIKSGSVKIQHSTKGGDAIDVATLSAGSHFGEMAFVDGAARSATATAAESCEIVAVPYEQLATLLSKNPSIAMKFYKEMSQFLATRLRATTSDLSYQKEKNHAHF